MANSFGPSLIDFRPLGTLGDSFLDAYDRSQRRRRDDERRATMRDIGQGLASGSLDYNQAAGRIAGLGELGGVVELLKLGEAAKQRQAGADASRALGEVLGGGFGLLDSATSTPASAGQDSALPTALKMSESGGNWAAQNNEVGAGGQRGHFGRAQFGQARLQEAAAAGAIPADTTPQQFMRSPELQKAAENWHFTDIDQFIQRNGLDKTVGRSINGVPVTLDGMRAVAHLGGKEGLAKFIASQGRYNPADANGTSLMDYLRLGARSGKVAQADVPALNAANAEASSGERGFFVPPAVSNAGMAPVDPMGNVTGPAPQAMSPEAFNQAAASLDAPPMPPVFQSEGVAQPWMGTALAPAPQDGGRPVQAPRAGRQAMRGEVLPPSRPYDLNADRAAEGGAPAIAQMPQQQLPAPIEIDPNSNDAGSRAFAVAQGQNAPAGASDGFIVPPAPQPEAALARTTGGVPAQPLPTASQPARFTGSSTAAPAAAPVLSKDLPRPANREEARDYTETRRMEANQGRIGKLAAALANPNLPANARAVGEVFLKDALEQSKAPESVKEFMYAKAMGWTTAKSPVEYAKEKQNAPTIVQEYEYAQRQGYKGSIIDYERDKAANKAKPGPTAADQKAIFAAEDELPAIDNTISTLSRALELNRQTYTGTGAGVKGMLGTSGIPGAGLIFDQQKAQATREFDQLMSFEAIKSMSALLKGATTEREMAEFQRLLGDPSTPPDIRERTINRMLTLAQRQKQIAEGRIDELRGRSGLDPRRQQQAAGERAAPAQRQRGEVADRPEGARQAPDGNWYVPDPRRPGKFLQVQ